jgi:acetyl esterase/lipase
MINQIIPLSKERNVSLTVYCIDNSEEINAGVQRPMVIVCPGGGYSFLSDREGELIALQYVAAGFHAAVRRYGICEHAVMPGPIRDIAGAISYIRDHAEEWYVNPDQIFVTGFSAGAHVAASIGVFWNNADLLPEYQDHPEKIKPNGMLLCYPVLDLKSSTNHLDIGIQPNTKITDIDFGQIHPKMPLEKIFVMDEAEGRYFVDFEAAMNAYLFDGEYTEEQEDFYSLQNQVSKDTPPAFIWHTAGDGLILPSNSLQFAAKLMEHQVPFEIHIFDRGDHGLGLGSYITANYKHEIVPAVHPWIDLAIAWLNRQTDFPNNVKTLNLSV